MRGCWGKGVSVKPRVKGVFWARVQKGMKASLRLSFVRPEEGAEKDSGGQGEGGGPSRAVAEP